MSLYAKGANYEIILVNKIAKSRVWRRLDLSWKEGAACAEEQVTHFEAISQKSFFLISAFLLDLIEAPRVSGPITQRCVAKIAALAESTQRKLAIVISEDQIQRDQKESIIKKHAPTKGRVFTSKEDAETWALTNIP